MQYVAWKQGDPKIKADPQTIKPKTWTALKFGDKGTTIMPKFTLFTFGLGIFAWYVNVEKPADAKVVKVRFVRDPAGKHDFTGQRAFSLAVDNISSGVWFFKVAKGVPVGVEVYHDGSKSISISTREFKAAIL